MDCDVSQFIGGSESKGKSNDWIYHNACFKDEIKRNEDVREVQYDADGIEMVFTYYIATDACPTQYRCRQNFLMAARICVEMFPNKIRVVHFIATKFGFKGAWDGDGGRSKIQLRRAETKSIRSPNALTAFKYLFDTMTRGTFCLGNDDLYLICTFSLSCSLVKYLSHAKFHIQIRVVFLSRSILQTRTKESLEKHQQQWTHVYTNMLPAIKLSMIH